MVTSGHPRDTAAAGFDYGKRRGDVDTTPGNGQQWMATNFQATELLVLALGYGSGPWVQAEMGERAVRVESRLQHELLDHGSGAISRRGPRG